MISHLNNRSTRALPAMLLFGSILLLCCEREQQEIEESTQRLPPMQPPIVEQAEDVEFRSPPEVRLGIVGFWGSLQHHEAFEPMASFLSERIDRPVSVVSAGKYDDLVGLLRSGELDLALLPPLVYVNMRGDPMPPRLLRTMVVDGAIHYSSYLIVRADSPIGRGEDLRGSSIGLVERSSASGYLFPIHWLMEVGIDSAKGDVQEVFLGSHDDVIRAVIEGRVDAGATFHGGLRSARAKGMDTGLVRVLAITGRIPLDALVAAWDLDPTLLDAIEAAFDEINTTNPQGREALFGLEIHGWVATSDDLYDPVREVLDRVRDLRGASR